MDDTFAILWHAKASGDYFYIRGVKPDGTFYGERRTPTEISNVGGQISAEDWTRCCAILDKIASGPPITPSPGWSARIGRWGNSLLDAEIVAGYGHGDEEGSDFARIF